MKILGLSFFYHDSAAALLVDGVPVAMSQEERFSRKKNDYRFPEKAINFVLESTKTKPEELDYVVFYEKPFLKLERVFKTVLSNYPFSFRVFVESVKSMFLDKLWVRDLVSRKLGIDPKKVLFSEHHLSHAASSFLCSPFDNAAILTIDGVGEWAVTTLGIGEGNKIKILKEIHFPDSLGLFYSAFTAFLGFEINEGEYKVMGMAPYGKLKYVDKVRKLIKFNKDGSYELDMSYFSFQNSVERTYSNKFIELFGPPRRKESKFFTRETGWPSYFGPKPEGEEYDRLAKEQEYYADIAASLQAVLEEALYGLAKELYRLTGVKKLCIGGGVGLNSVANWKILANSPFEEIFIQPAAGDAGGALGAALSVYCTALNNPRKFVMENAYYGKEYSREEIKEFIDKNNLKAELFENEDDLIDKVIDDILAGKVVGWFQGRFEWGPRALGSRSILADPRRNDMKDIVNTKIKFREPYRPFAPSVILEGTEEFFEMPEAAKHYPGRYMLYVVNVREDKKAKVPAITHVDGTARPQVVLKEESPKYWKLINNFYQKTGVSLLLNTSFNLRGEPIVNTPQDAYSTFERSEIDTLVLENYIIKKQGT
ncbi:MAG: carbamoyltransferase N-terminal domain-containing protein [Candidatus Pacebacteria bacterium]|nr:carbamoyltransferase N-terminal domain-containing protein [Candidatus Paceibacterota bacterium]